MKAKVSPAYWVAWKEKLWSLFVSGKLVLFFSTLAAATVLLITGYIPSDVWEAVMMTNITVVAGFRGAVEIADIMKKSKGEKNVDED